MGPTYSVDSGILSWGWSGWGLMLTTHFHPVSRLRISGAIHLLPSAFMTWTSTTLPFRHELSMKNHSAVDKPLWINKGTRNRRKLVTQYMSGRGKWGCCQLLNFPAVPTEWHTCRKTRYHVNARNLPSIYVDITKLPGQGRWLTHAITSPAASTSPTKYWSWCGRRPPPTILQGCPFCSGTCRHFWFYQVRHHTHFANSLWGGI